MSTSGSVNWTQTRNTIINAALRKIGALSSGENPSASALIEAAESLNRMIKAWQNTHKFKWKTELDQQTFSASSEVTGTDGNIYTCILGHTSASDNKPVTGANYSTYWYQTGSTGGVWATSTAYTAIGDFALDSDAFDITKAFIRDGYKDLPVEIISREKYFNIEDKWNTGTPEQIYIDKQLSPKCYLYPQPDSTDLVLHLLKVKFLEDFDAASDNPDSPSRWMEAMVCGLAYKLSSEYGIPLNERESLRREALIEFNSAKKGDKETTDGDFISNSCYA